MSTDDFFKKPIEEFTDKEVMDMLDVLSADIKRRNILMGAPDSSDPQTVVQGLQMLETLIKNIDQVMPKAKAGPRQSQAWKSPSNRRRKSPSKS